MKDRIVFFVLGAVLATVAYFVGDMDKTHAQDDVKVFDGDVIINGRLYVNSGQVMIKYDPLNTDDMSKVPSGIALVSDMQGASILLTNGPIKNIGERPSRLLLTASEYSESGVNYSAIVLKGDYDKDTYAITSDKELTEIK